jgi:hypothetical protein
MFSNLSENIEYFMGFAPQLHQVPLKCDALECSLCKFKCKPSQKSVFSDFLNLPTDIFGKKVLCRERERED